MDINECSIEIGEDKHVIFIFQKGIFVKIYILAFSLVGPAAGDQHGGKAVKYGHHTFSSCDLPPCPLRRLYLRKLEGDGRSTVLPTEAFGTYLSGRCSTAL